MMNAIPKVLSLASQASKAGSGVQALASLTGYLDKVMALVSGAAAKVNPNLLATGNVLVAAGTVATIGSSVLQGQEVGGVLSFGKGIVDIGSENYYDHGSDQSGTAIESVGNVVQGLGISAYTALVSSGRLAEMLGSKAKYIGLITKALFAWQASTMVDEVARGDGDPLKDKLDVAGNALSLISLAALGKKGLLRMPINPGPRSFAIAA